MTEQEVRWTADRVLALAPDAASRAAGGEVAVAGLWSGAGSSGAGTVWGLWSGGDGAPYRTAVDIADPSGPAYTCGCPTRGAPCEHALGLLLLWADGAGTVPRAPVPGWAEQWVAGRRTGAGEGSTADAAGPPPAAAAAEAARRRAERRAGRVTAGAEELEQRLADLLRAGLASAGQAGHGMWEETAARMVDAQAPGLATRVRELAALTGGPVRLLEECALLHLLARGWLRRDRLPEGLAATVRTRVGLTASAEGPPVRDRWLVLAQYDTADSRLTTRRVWLYGTGSGRTVLLLSYGAAGRAPELALPVGQALDAELSAYRGAAGPRAALGERFAAPAPTAVRPPGTSPTRAMARYGEALRDDPWLDSVPVTLDRVVPAPDGDGWQLADAGGDTALPLSPTARTGPGLWRLVALSGGAPVRVFGECGHQGFTPLAAWPEGPGEVVPLC